MWRFTHVDSLHSYPRAYSTWISGTAFWARRFPCRLKYRAFGNEHYDFPAHGPIYGKRCFNEASGTGTTGTSNARGGYVISRDRIARIAMNDLMKFLLILSESSLR